MIPAKLTSLLVLATCAVFGAGCGAGGSQPTGAADTTLTITRDFGAQTVTASGPVPLTAGLTAMRQLQAQTKTKTSFGGRYVESIGDLKEDADSAWLIYVNGIELDRGAAATRLQAGDAVQWDFHAWQLMRTGGAIVGAYPKPLKASGVRLVCAPATGAPCKLARKNLLAAGIAENNKSSSRVIVGSWNDIEGFDEVPDLTQPAESNGAYAEFTKDGQTLALATGDGSQARALARGGGLLAAFAQTPKSVVWLVTGTDTAGVKAAARLLAEPQRLRSRFALATRGNQPIPLPVDEG